MRSPRSRAGARIEPARETPLSVALLDRDGDLVHLLSRPMRALGWEVSELTEPPDTETLSAMGVGVLLIDMASIDMEVDWLSRQASEMPEMTIFACSEDSTVAQRVRGLQVGLDGWISKPYNAHELLARIQAILRARRSGQATAHPPVHSGELQIDATRYDALAAGRSAGLTTREFEVFSLLVHNKGAVLTREDIYAGVWGHDVPSGDRSVDIFVSRIRVKLKRLSPGWTYLHTHIGLGYRFEAEREASAEERLTFA